MADAGKQSLISRPLRQDWRIRRSQLVFVATVRRSVPSTNESVTAAAAANPLGGLLRLAPRGAATGTRASAFDRARGVAEFIVDECDVSMRPSLERRV
jgi:hypothetical protein